MSIIFPIILNRIVLDIFNLLKVTAAWYGANMIRHEDIRSTIGHKRYALSKIIRKNNKG